MSSSISLRSPFLPSRPFSSTLKTRHTNTRSKLSVLAEKRDVSGHMVDENMIVLRKRIHETKMAERNYEPPSDWMDWEKRCYTGYDEYICEAMGVLQSGLMNTRPSMALGMMVLLTLSVPVSTLVVVSSVVELAKGILGGSLH